MLRSFKAALLATVTAAITVTGLAGVSAAATPTQAFTGVVRTLAADTVDHRANPTRFVGASQDVYRRVLITAQGQYFLSGKIPPNDAKVRVTGSVKGGELNSTSFTTLVSGAAVAANAISPAVADTGTSRVLTMLAYWTAPDSVTPASAASQLYTDSNGWYREASYGALGQTGDVTPWMQIAAPTSGCYANSDTLMTEAKSAATALGYAPASYDNVILYFPNCAGDAAGFAGWAFVGAAGTWLNGYLDRRVTVHEQGHNYGLWHSHSYMCSGAGLEGTCQFDDYGDLYDAMGSSSYVGHFNASQKSALGWTGTNTVNLSGGGTATLLPMSNSSSGPHAASVTTASGRVYWIEYRQPTGYDSALPVEGTNGVLIHVSGTGSGSTDTAASLIDPTLANGISPSSSTLQPGQKWTSDDGVVITAGTANTSGATVQVTLPNQATVPGAPSRVTAVGGNGSATVSWAEPASDGGAAISKYTVTASPGGKTLAVAGSATTATVTGLTNGTAYTFTVTATNSAGTGAASAASNSVTPVTSPGGPDSPGQVSVAVVSTTSASVSWSPPVNPGGSAITGYIVSRDGVDSQGAGAYSTTVPATTRTFSFTRLVGTTTYHLTVQAVTAGGTSAPAGGAVSTSSSTALRAPTATSVVESGAGALTISWSPPAATGGQTVTGYVVSRDGVDSRGSGAYSTTVAASIRSFTMTRLVTGSAYTLSVQAVTAASTGPASTGKKVVVTYVSAPASVAVTKSAAGSATITWQPPATTSGLTLTGYRVSRDGTDAAGVGPYATVVPATTRSFTMTKLATGSKYTLSVQAVTSTTTYSPASGTITMT